jgi:tRNA(Arg) A34 adenosine deaminase TadA
MRANPFTKHTMNHAFQTLISLAQKAASLGEVPIAAMVTDAQGTLISIAHNEVEMRRDATAHAELLALQAAMKIRGEKYLEDCTLYVTLEPCAMCAQAISLAKIGKLVFGAYDAKGGGVEHGARIFTQSTCHHQPEIIGGVMEAECGQLLTQFFQKKR